MAAQIIHLQNKACHTIVKKPQNDVWNKVWLVKFWNYEDKWVTETENWFDNKFHQMNPFYGNAYM